MLRTALQPRFVALLVLALALATAFATLGNWQLERSRRDAAPQAPRKVVELTDVARPQSTLEGAAVLNDIRARGSYRGDQQLEVVDRALDGRPGSWVLTPMTVEADGESATLPVVRGWVPEGVQPPAPPSGQVEVVGRLQGSEVPAGPEADLRAGQTRVVSAADLVNLWGPPIYAGYLVVTSPVQAPLHPVPPKVPGDDGGGFHLLNLSYALQWWVFAGFAVFLWWRIVRDSHLAALEEKRDDDEDGDHDGEDDDIEGGADPRRPRGDNEVIHVERGAQR